MTKINNNLNSSVMAQIALWGANVIEWISENLAALCSRVNSLFWKGEGAPASSLEARVEVLPKATAADQEQESEPATHLNSRVAAVVLNLSQIKIKEIIEILKAAQKDHGKLLEYVTARNRLPPSVINQHSIKYKELIEAAKRAGLERTTESDIAAALIAFEEIAQGI